MSYYFTNNTGKTPNRKKITFRFLANLETFISDDGVFSKDTLDFGSRALLETIIEESLRGSLLDLGCGIGYIGVLLKKYHPDLNVTMADINETAVRLAQENSRLYGQKNRVLVSDGFANIDDRFDVIVTNPPIRTGKANIYRLFSESMAHLNEEGIMYIVIRKRQGAESAMKYLETLGKTEIVDKVKGYWIISVRKRHLTD